MVQPLTAPSAIVKKRIKPFLRYQSDRKICVPVRACRARVPGAAPLPAASRHTRARRLAALRKP